MMKIKNVYFFKSCASHNQFPEFAFPEFAFLGRSNVGKSSLLNMILGQKSLVRTGARPGVTQTINFFIANDKISFADLPGFGYAKVSAEIRKKFLPLVKSYLEKRNNLKLVFLLIDIRRTPGDWEEDLLLFLEKNNIPSLIILTKSDKLSENQKKNRVKDITQSLGIDKTSIIISSCKTGEGKKNILSVINEFSQNPDSISAS